MNEKYVWMNRDTGEVFTEQGARKEWREEYDGDDPTNCMEFSLQYERISERNYNYISNWMSKL